MINTLDQNVPTTASFGSLGEEGASSNRTDNPDFEKRSWLFRPFKWEHVSAYPDINRFLQAASAISPNQISMLVRPLFGWSSLVNHLDSKYSLPYLISASSTKSLADKVMERNTAFTQALDLTLYERALNDLRFMATAQSSGLTQTTALMKLDELKNLSEDWDSYGAEPISPNAIAKAKSIVTLVMRAFNGLIGNVVQITDVIPIADGGVQLEWVGPHAELEIEISPNGTIGLLYISVSEGRRKYEESEDNSFRDVYLMIAKLIQSQYNS